MLVQGGVTDSVGRADVFLISTFASVEGEKQSEVV